MQPTIIVIIGITGDLATRKLLPALEEIVQAKVAPKKLKIIGITRRAVGAKEVLASTKSPTKFLDENLEMYQMDLTAVEDYHQLAKRLKEVEKAWGESTQTLFYLSVPPQISSPIIRMLGEANLNSPNAKLLLEKPFGVDLVSAQELVEETKQSFAESQIYRIDHYLAKEMAQNLVVFRQSNPLFREAWNARFIESVEIIASESIGIEGRALFYEQTGALRDLVQSHLLQLAALVLAEVRSSDWSALPKARLQALRQIMTPTDIAKQAVRGQYQGYRQEVDNPDSMVETYVSLTLFSENPEWQDVPIKLVTGKALDKKATEIRVTFKHEEENAGNVLALRIQPEEGVEIDVWAKQPGYDRKLMKYPLKFAYSNHPERLAEAYERVFVDAMRGDRTLFATSDEVLETWRILEPIQQAWSMHSDGLVLYKPGVSADLT